MPRRLLVIFVTCCVLAAALFARLGMWQLSRLAQRKAFNAVVASRLDSAVVPASAVPRDPQLARFRRVRLVGAWDRAHEVVLTGRSFNGSPGAHLLTPVRVAGSDTAFLVNRGWVYAPDGAAIPDPGRWRARGDSARVEGFVVQLPPVLPRATTPGTLPAVRWLDTAAFAQWAGYPAHAFQVVMEGDTLVARDSLPARLSPPSLGEGSHRGYAFQWFAFAVIALVGMPVFLVTRRREAERARAVPPAPPPPR